MALRTLTHQGRSWTVQAASERRSTTSDWQLIFGFRPVGAGRTSRTHWVAHTFTALDKASLLRQAELVNDDELLALLESVEQVQGG